VATSSSRWPALYDAHFLYWLVNAKGARTPSISFIQACGP
jgi:hypothetical protein